MERHWHIAYTASKFEKKIQSRLMYSNISSYLPLHKVLRSWSDRKKRVELPLFPNYIFVNINEKEKSQVLSVPGVIRFITFEGRPATVKEDIIDTIKNILTHAPDISEEDTVETGEKVRVIQGPFLGMQGIVLNRNGKKRIAIMLEGIEKIISVDISPYHLEKIT